MLPRTSADNHPRMDRVSRPLIGLLVATVAFFALWVTMLKPSSSETGGTGSAATGPSLGQLNSAITAAHGAVATSNAASVRHGGVVPPGSPGVPAARHVISAPGRIPATTTASAVHTAHHASPGRHAVHVRPPQTAAARLRLVARALEDHQVLAMLFYNPAGSDDRLVRQELAEVPTHHGAVVKLSIPLSEVASYSIITQQVPVTGSPTLVIVDRGRGATEIVGFADTFEIAQRIDDALAVR